MSSKAKTRIEIAEEYGISRRTLQRWLKKEKIEVSKGLIKPEELNRIYDRFGKPEKEKANRFRDWR
jgi:predicted site-specific integrase-resolvase